MPTPTELQFDGRLTNIAVQYNNPEYIADLVLPPVPVPKKTGKYKTYAKDERFTVPPTLVGPRSEPNEVEWSTSEDTYTCADYALKEFVSQEEIDNAEAPIQPMADATDFVTNLLMLAKEHRVATAVFASANYAAGNQLDVEGGWATLSDDALTDLQTGIDACFAPPNVLVMGQPTWAKLARNATLLAAIKGTLAPQFVQKGGLASPQIDQSDLADFLGLDHVLVGRAKRNTAKPGQTASYSPVWDGTTATKGGAALLRINPAPGRDVVSMSHFHWKETQVFTYPSTRGAFGGTVVQVVESNVVKVVANDVGYLFKDVLAT